jgi:hypothetical protein
MKNVLKKGKKEKRKKGKERKERKRLLVNLVSGEFLNECELECRLVESERISDE